MFMNNKDLLIGVDYSSSSDHAAVSYTCSACKAVIRTDMIKNTEEELVVGSFQKCPQCGLEFVNTIVKVM